MCIYRLFLLKMLSCSLRARGCSPLFILWVLLLLPLASAHQLDQHGDHSSSERPKLLLVSFDGFRWDYILQVPMPNFNAVARDGVMVEQVENTYITKTFPNHYSLVTGLYAESHGIVANEMYDSALNHSFSMETDSIYESQWWEEAEPLWVTIQRSGGRSGAAMWPGSDVRIHGVFPNQYLRYNASVSFESRVQRIIEWFSAPRDESVNFGVLYWEEPDQSGHKLGPQNPEMDRVITEIDENLGFLVNELKKAGLYENMNLIVTSDHGMTQLPDEHIIELDQYVDRDLYTWVDKSPVVGILPKEGPTMADEQVFLILRLKV